MALDYIHRKGVLHRALSLDSVAISENAHVKLAGFALPGLIARGQNFLQPSDREYCLSPELCRGEGHHTNKGDVWSLGCLMWALASLEYPFHGRSLQQLVRNIFAKPLRADQLPGCYSQPFRHIITNKLLNKDQYKRPGPSELLFDSTMIKNMQQYAATASQLKKEF